MAKKIIENKDEVTQWEKIIKSGIAILGLIYIAVTSEAFKGKDTQFLPSYDLLQTFTNHSAIKDFFSREGLILILVVSAYILARRYNVYLDGIE